MDGTSLLNGEEWIYWGRFDSVVQFLIKYKLGKGYKLSVAASFISLLLQVTMSIAGYGIMSNACANSDWSFDSEDYQSCVDAANKVNFGWIGVIVVPLSFIAASSSFVQTLTIPVVLTVYVLSSIFLGVLGIAVAISTISLIGSALGFVYFIDIFLAFMYVGGLLWTYKRGTIELTQSKHTDEGVLHTAIHSYKKRGGQGYFAPVENVQDQIIFKVVHNIYYVKNSNYGRYGRIIV